MKLSRSPCLECIDECVYSALDEVRTLCIRLDTERQELRLVEREYSRAYQVANRLFSAHLAKETVLQQPLNRIQVEAI